MYGRYSRCITTIETETDRDSESCCNILGLLKCKLHRVLFTATVEIDNDILRFVSQEKGRISPDGKFMLYNKDDFNSFALPQYWYYCWHYIEISFVFRNGFFTIRISGINKFRTKDFRFVLLNHGEYFQNIRLSNSFTQKLTV